MAIINYTDQIKYAGRGYLDAKMMPVKTVDELKKIPASQRFEGLTIVVLNDGMPQDYWLIGGTSNSCWLPKTATNFTDLRLALENGFLKLTNAGIPLGDGVDLKSFFPENEANDLYIKSIDYSTQDDNGKTGIFMCFTYSDETKKYLDMSQFLAATYTAGEGIVIDGNVISLDEAISGRIIALEESIEKANASITALNAATEAHKASISENSTALSVLKTRVDALTTDVEGATPDGITIGITDDDSKALCVKILEKEGNMLSVETHNGSTGLYASFEYICEDEEIKE